MKGMMLEVKKKLYILLCIIFLSVFTITFTVQGVTIEQLIKEKRDELGDKIEEITKMIDDVSGEIVVVSDELIELNERIAQYQEEINNLNMELSQIEVEIEKTEEELIQAEENYEKQKKLLEDRIIAMYKGGETVYLDVLLKSKNIEDFLSKYYYLVEVTKLDRKLVESVQKEKEKITIKHKKLLAQKEKLKLTSDNKERTAITLQNTKVIRNSYLNGLNEQQLAYQQNLSEYEKSLEDLEKDILSVSLSTLNEEYIGGSLLWPVPGYTTITSPYGMRIHPLFKIRRMHTGVDVGAPTGVPVVAVNGGVVTLAEYSGSYGNYIMINHGGGVVTLYAHASKLLVTVGDIVQAGDVIMEIGSTGWSTGPHLHFEVRIEGNPVNPLPYITKASASALTGKDFTNGVDIGDEINKSTSDVTTNTIEDVINSTNSNTINAANSNFNIINAVNVKNNIVNETNLVN